MWFSGSGADGSVQHASKMWVGLETRLGAVDDVRDEAQIENTSETNSLGVAAQSPEESGVQRTTASMIITTTMSSSPLSNRPPLQSSSLLGGSK